MNRYLDAGLDVNLSVPVAEGNMTLLTLACTNGNAEVASLLLSRGAAVESSALYRAVIAGTRTWSACFSQRGRVESTSMRRRT